MKFSLYIFLILANSAFAISYVSMTDTLSDEGYELNFKNYYFRPSSSYGHDSVEIPLKANQSYITLDSEIWIKYGLTSQLEGFIAPRFRMNRSRNLNGDFSKSGVESIFVGVNYAWKREEGMQYKLESFYRKGMFTNESYKTGDPVTDIVLGDEGDGYYLGFALSYLTKSNNYIDLRVGYHHPTSNLSNEVVTETRLVAAWDVVALMMGIDYVHSLSEDPYASDTANKPQISTGQTYLWNSINRTFTDAYLGMNFGLGKLWRFESKVAYRVQGTSTDKGLGFTVSLVRRKSAQGLNFKNKNNAFKQYEIDGIVTKVTKSKKAVLVNKGVRDGLNKGDRVDFYHFDYLDGDELIAAGVVVKSSYDKAIVKVLKRYSKRRIADGTVFRSGLIK